MKIARVFPTKTSITPNDQDAYTGIPDLFTPDYDEIHISVAFTWDIPKAKELMKAWEGKAPVVKMGGPAITGEGDEFIPGRYVAPGTIITSRGCPNRCPFCLINKPIKELPIIEGNNIIDNNLLACSPGHVARVFEMLKDQHMIKFTGGLEASRIKKPIIDLLKGINLRRLFTAWDSIETYGPVYEAIKLMRESGLTQHQVNCYILMGYDRSDTPEKAEKRCRAIFNLGATPFAMLYRNKAGDIPEPHAEWKAVHRNYSRPAVTKYLMKEALTIFNID